MLSQHTGTGHHLPDSWAALGLLPAPLLLWVKSVKSICAPQCLYLHSWMQFMSLLTVCLRKAYIFFWRNYKRGESMLSVLRWELGRGSSKPHSGSGATSPCRDGAISHGHTITHLCTHVISLPHVSTSISGHLHHLLPRSTAGEEDKQNGTRTLSPQMVTQHWDRREICAQDSPSKAASDGCIASKALPHNMRRALMVTQALGRSGCLWVGAEVVELKEGSGRAVAEGFPSKVSAEVTPQSPQVQGC